MRQKTSEAPTLRLIVLIQAINSDFSPFFLIDNLNPNEYNPLK